MLFTEKYISPFKEILAYEALWNRDKASFKRISELFAQNPGSTPSYFVNQEEVDPLYDEVKKYIAESDYLVNLLINGTIDYPNRLQDAKEPVELLYYAGNLEYLYTDSIAVVGTRNPTEEGLKRTQKLVNYLVEDNITIVSGLAKGIDTMAHKTAIEKGGRTIAVLGTSLNSYYPASNKELQNIIAKEHLLISQVPYYRYAHQSPNGNRLFFPERNKTMSALTKGTIIIEASDTSGTLIQAKAAIDQGRKLFILESCFHNKNIKWPEKYLGLGAIRVKEYADIKNNL
jgi:DNA processing protein